MELDQARATIDSIAECLGVRLEPALSSVTVQHDGRLQLVVTLHDAPHTSFERSVLHSAFLGEVLEHFPKAVIQVHLPPVESLQESTRPTGTLAVAEWIGEQMDGVHSWAREAALMVTVSSYAKAIEAYPWRGKAAMKAMIPSFAHDMQEQLNSCGSKAVFLGNVDPVLRPLESILNVSDRITLMQDVTRHNHGTLPCRLLEVYECVYDMVTRDVLRDPVTDRVFPIVFDA